VRGEYPHNLKHPAWAGGVFVVLALVLRRCGQLIMAFKAADGRMTAAVFSSSVW